MSKKFPEGVEKSESEEKLDSQQAPVSKVYTCFSVDMSTPVPTIKHGVRRNLELMFGEKRRISPREFSDLLSEMEMKASDGKLVGGQIVFKKPVDEEDDE